MGDRCLSDFLLSVLDREVVENINSNKVRVVFVSLRLC